jgi:hypothetical protein
LKLDDNQPDTNPPPRDVATMLATLLNEGYGVSFALDAAGRVDYLADLAGPLGSQATGLGGTPAAALASVWPFGDAPADEPGPADAAASSGPFHTERDALRTPAVRAVFDAYRPAAPAGHMKTANLAMLTAACQLAGVELGAYDARILAWLAGFEPTTCAVIAGITTRAGAAINADLAARLASLRDHLAEVLDDGDRDRQYALERAERELAAICQDVSPATGEAAGR